MDFVNLGADYTDEQAPKFLKDTLINVINSNPMIHQYSPNIGLPRTLEAIAKIYSKVLNLELSSTDNVIVTAGATEALHVAFLSYTSPGDEWIVIEPAYTVYIPAIKLAKGVPRITTLKLKTTGDERSSSKNWKLDKDELESLFNVKTRGILINNPNNPTGKSFTLEELKFIADLVKKWNVLVIADEVHEWINYDTTKHLRIMQLPGMFNRTIAIGSSSKAFGVTGWRVGWVYGPVDMINFMKTVHRISVHSAPTLFQEIIAVALEQEICNFGKDNSYFVRHINEMKQKRNYILELFRNVGMQPIVPDSGHCILINWTTLDTSKIDFDKEEGNDKGVKFNNWIIKNIGVLGVPLSTFYSDNQKHLGENYIRYSFQKKDDTLKEAALRLLKLKS